MKLDQINISIINHLRDGRAPFKKIAEALSIAEGTVRSRVRRLMDEGVLEVAGLVDPEAIPDQSVAMIGVRLSDRNLVKKGEEFSRLRGVITVCVVTGRYDLIVTVMLNREFTLLEFYADEVAMIDNVAAVEAFVVNRSFNLKVPLTR